VLLPVTRYKRKKTSKAHSDSVARSGKVEDAGAEADGRRRNGTDSPFRLMRGAQAQDGRVFASLAQRQPHPSLVF